MDTSKPTASEREALIAWLEREAATCNEPRYEIDHNHLKSAAAELSRLAKENGRWRKAVSQAVNDCAEDAAANADLSKRCQSDEDAAFRDGKQEAYSQMQRQLSAILKGTADDA